MHRDEIQKIKNDMDEPSENQARDNILSEHKYAFVFANEYFSDDKIGMNDLPEVKDDFKNMLQAVKQMHIPSENIFAYQNIKFEKVKEIYTHVTNIIKAETRSLTGQTGIHGGAWLTKGIEWIKIRSHALKEGASLDFVIVSSQ